MKYIKSTDAAFTVPIMAPTKDQGARTQNEKRLDYYLE